jgi:hypothetical protein
VGFKPISHSDEDYDFYDQIRQELIREQFKRSGVRPKISLADVVKTGVTFWNQRRKIVKDKQDDKRSQSQN